MSQYQYQYQVQGCPRCGAPLAPGGVCANCGLGTAPPSVLPTVLVTFFFGFFGAIAAGMATGRAARTNHPRGKYWAAFAITLVVPVAIAIVAGVLLFATFARDQEIAVLPTNTTTVESGTPAESAPSESGPPQQSAPPESSPPVTSSTPAPAPSSTAPSSTTPTSRTVTVANTCGRDGTGDCFLTERSQPSTSGASIRRWDEGSTLAVVCQVRGSRVTASATGVSSDIWSRTSTGGYVTNVYLSGVDQRAITTPCA